MTTPPFAYFLACCDTCKFFLPHDAEYYDGFCHRYPPQLSSNPENIGEQSYFPGVTKSDWCGEWKRDFTRHPDV